MSRTFLASLGQRLDERAPHLADSDAYMSGTQPLTFLSPEARAALGSRLRQVNVNVPRLVVASLTERLRVTGFHSGGQPDPSLWRLWMANDLDQTSATAHREALALGSSYVIVWAGRDQLVPRITVESAHQVIVARDPATRAVLAALKRWELPNGQGQVVVVYEPDVITKYTTNAAGAPADSGAWRVAQTTPNPLGAVPVVPLVNAERLLDLDGRPEFADAIPLTDALVKVLTDMLVTSEYYARPRRWATGVEVPVDAAGEPVNPFAGEVDRTWISEAPESKFGQFTATDLGAYENATTVLLKALSAVTGLPEHVLGVGSDNPTSADSIRASEAALTARTEARQRTFGRSWEQVARLAVAVRDGADPASVDVSVQWADPATRSVAQEADAVVKLYGAGLLPASVALARLGYTEDEILTIRTARRTEALDGAGVDLAALLP